MIDFTSMSSWMLIVYGAISGAMALLYYELVDILASKEKRQRFKENILKTFRRHKK